MMINNIMKNNFITVLFVRISTGIDLIILSLEVMIVGVNSISDGIIISSNDISSTINNDLTGVTNWKKSVEKNPRINNEKKLI